VKRIAIYPGSFDPVTNGHIDIIARARHLFDEIIVAVSDNPSKNPYFSLPERLEFMREAVKSFPGVRTETFKGLLSDYVKKKKAVAVIRGIRAVSDFEYEFQMALMNRRLHARFETVFLMPDEKYTYLSSSIVREVSRLGGQVKGLVPSHVEVSLRKRANL
jgi:pantetheine-phosphate adenylyltransferase